LASSTPSASNAVVAAEVVEGGVEVESEISGETSVSSFTLSDDIDTFNLS